MVKQGYKRTEIGAVPKDWETITFKNCFDILPNNTFSRAELNCENGKIRNIHYGDILVNYGAILDCSNESLPYVNNVKKIKSSAYLRNGDLIIADTAEDETVGKATEVFNISDGIVVSGLHTIPCRPKYATMFAPKWLGYFANDYTYHTQILPYITGTKVSAISKGAIATTVFLVPPLAEQKRIAEALSDVDGMISSLEKLIAKKKAVKQGTMQELLTGKKRLAGFDKAWEVFLLGDIGTITGSGVDKKILPDEEPITLLNYTNVYHQISIARQDLNHQVTASSEKIKNCYVLKGDVFLTPTSETPEDIALSAVATEDMPDVVYSYHVVRLRPNLNFNGAFVNYALSVPMFREQALQFAEGSGIRYVITLKKFKEMQVFIPTEKAEQDAIISILSDMDNEIEALEQKLAKTRQLKQGMMQQLLTGKIRLVGKETITDITAEQENPPETKTGHNHQFDDAVMIAAIVNSFYSEKYPLGRKKVQKLLYLLRRKQEADTSEFKKKAAGPYADEIRYKGGEPIAKKNGYISATTTPKGIFFSKGKKMDAALSYVKKWKMQSDIDWLVSNFKYIGVNDLELYATIDMAICDLRNEGVGISVDSVKELIRSNSEWKAKLKKSYFSDIDIARAINMSNQLYS